MITGGSRREAAPDRTLSRRKFLQTVVGSTGVLLLAACAQPAAQPTPTTAPKPTTPPAAPTPTAAAAKPTAAPAAATPTAAPKAAPASLKGTKVHLLNWSSFVPEEDKWLKENLVNEWAKPNGVDLTVELVAGNQVQPKVVAALQAGAGPDILQMQWTWAHLYADKLTDVSDLAEKLGSDGGGWYEVSKQNNFVGGRWRAIPWAITGNAIAYRTSWLKEATGSDKFPETFDDLAKAGAEVKKKKNVFYGQAIGHSFGDPPTWFYPFLWAHGGSETDQTGKRVTINSPETEAALKAWKAFFDAASDPECLSWDDSSNNRAYLAEQIWATLNGASIYVAALKDKPDLAKDTNHALIPKGPKGQFLLAFPISFAIPTYVKDPTPARELLSYLLSTKTYAEWMKQGKGYTQAPYKKGETAEMWPSTDPKFEPYKLIGQLSKWYGYPASPSPAAAESGSKYIVVDMFAKVSQGESPQAAMQWAEGELKKIYGG
jgi:multiple sugar transport system substrate-binding protein